MEGLKPACRGGFDAVQQPKAFHWGLRSFQLCLEDGWKQVNEGLVVPGDLEIKLGEEAAPQSPSHPRRAPPQSSHLCLHGN